MASDPEVGVDDAYALETPDDNRQLYAKWAETYDEGFIEAKGYVYHLNVVGEFMKAGGSGGGAVLDVGCGTGNAGVALADAGEAIVDGIDISPEMLEVAATKRSVSGRPAYRHSIEADLTARLALPDDTYSGVVSSGTFTHGHVGPSALEELLRVAEPGALFAIGVNEHHFAEQKFDRWFADRAEAGTITTPSMVPVQIYENMEGHHADTQGIVAIFRAGAAKGPS